MEYGLSDSSGTDDDIPPSNPNRFKGAGNRRSAVVGTTTTTMFPRVHGDIQTKIHLIEQEAYTSVLRAFKAQSDAITWEKESLITELRKELRVSDDEHREILSRVNSDDVIRQIREWRKGNGGNLQNGVLNSNDKLNNVYDKVASPTITTTTITTATTSVSAPKKQKTSHSSLGPPPPPIRPSMQQQPSLSAVKHLGNDKPKSGSQPRAIAGLKERNFDSSFVGKKVWTRWPTDNSFYQALIQEYKPLEGLHALVYDINTPDETWEWVNLKEISPEDIRWEGDDLGISRRGAHIGSKGHRNAKKELNGLQQQNGTGKKAFLGNIEIMHTDALVKEVERVFGSTHPDPIEVEKAKKVLKEHELALIDAIARLENASDIESVADRGEGRVSLQGLSMDDEERRRLWKKRRDYDDKGEEKIERRRIGSGQQQFDEML